MNRELILKISLPLLTFLIAGLGALSNISTDRTWYDSLNKASLNPPDYLFTLMAVVSFLHAKLIYKWYIPQLALNGAWTWIFFVCQQPDIAFINIVVLIGLNLVILMKLKGQGAWLSFALYLPYLLWICFAAFLNISIAILN